MRNTPARQFPELLVATVAVEAEDLCLGADAETFIALVHEQGPIGQTSARRGQLVNEAQPRAVLYWIARRESWTLIADSMLAPPPPFE